ncbi:MAG: alpha/beta hydrolase [Cycloclasticus sp.]|nr:alpha/beta hydrolase [Cycloclasticus sp.]
MKLSGVKLVSVFKVVLLTLTACASSPNIEQRTITSNQLATHHGWKSVVIVTNLFDLMSYQPKQINAATILTVYIEGDGFAWRTRSIPSTDPTPINPIGLKLALNHPDGNAAYLARPCQYTSGNNVRGCEKTYWTDKRFSEDVIAASNQAITALKEKFGATQLQLVGYSGGGAVAALLTARRSDVIRLITVAGNLDHHAWTDAKQISPLTGSLNPADYWQALSNIEQVHFTGGNDLIIGNVVAQSYKQHFSDDGEISIISLPNFDHHCCWVEQWNRLSTPYLIH